MYDCCLCCFFFFKQYTACEMRISDWSSDVCSSDLVGAFAAAFDAEVRRQLCEDDLTGRLLTDGQLSVEEFHLELARALRNAGPWGQHFPEPMFHGLFQVVQQRLVGDKHQIGRASCRERVCQYV